MNNVAMCTFLLERVLRERDPGGQHMSVELLADVSSDATKKFTENHHCRSQQDHFVERNYTRRMKNDSFLVLFFIGTLSFSELTGMLKTIFVKWKNSSTSDKLCAFFLRRNIKCRFSKEQNYVTWRDLIPDPQVARRLFEIFIQEECREEGPTLWPLFAYFSCACILSNTSSFVEQRNAVFERPLLWKERKVLPV